MNILVTGGAGFIGSHLCEQLLKNGNHVVCLDDLSTGRQSNIEHLIGNQDFKLVKASITDKAKLHSVFKENSIDMAYHYAAVVGVIRTFKEPKKVLDVNISGTENVLEAALNSGCKKVVLASSSEVYGNPVEVPEKETSPKNIELPYAASKLVNELYADIYHRQHGLKTVSLRFFNVYGPRQDSSSYGFVVGIFIDQVLNNKPPVIFGDGFATRDFTYIEDNILPSIIAGEKEFKEPMVINIAAGKPVTILDLAETIIELCGKDLKPSFAPEREHEIKHRFGDISMMRKLLNYKPKYELKDGLKLTIDWYRKTGKKG